MITIIWDIPHATIDSGQIGTKKRKVHRDPSPLKQHKHLTTQRTKRSSTKRTTAQHQRSKRRSQRLQTRSLTTCDFFDGEDSSDCSIQPTVNNPRRRFTPNVSQNTELAALKAVPITTFIVASPMNALDNSFYSQAQTTDKDSIRCDESSKSNVVPYSSDFESESHNENKPSKLHVEPIYQSVVSLYNM